jgi:hypothetical protein
MITRFSGNKLMNGSKKRKRMHLIDDRKKIRKEILNYYKHKKKEREKK